MERSSTAKIFMCSGTSLGLRKACIQLIIPQTNGQVESINKIVKFNLKTKLEEHKVLWEEELPKMLWAYRTTSWTSTVETPFSMSTGSKQ